MYFESKKGGKLDVASVDLDIDSSTAHVSFENNKCKRFIFVYILNINFLITSLSNYITDITFLNLKYEAA